MVDYKIQSLAAFAGDGEVSLTWTKPANANNNILYQYSSGILQGGLDTNTKLMLHLDEIFGPSIDSSFSAHTITEYETHPGSFSSINYGQFGIFGKSLNLRYAGIRVDAHSDFNFGTNDFTIDFRCNVDSNVSSLFYCWDSSSDTGIKIALGQFGAAHGCIGVKLVVGGNSVDIATDAYFVIQAWHHIALVRHQGTIKIFFDGQLKGQTSVVRDFNVNGRIYIGAITSSINAIITVDEIRVSKDIARWNSDFEVPNKTYFENYRSWINIGKHGKLKKLNIGNSLNSFYTFIVSNLTNDEEYSLGVRAVEDMDVTEENSVSTFIDVTPQTMKIGEVNTERVMKGLSSNFKTDSSGILYKIFNILAMHIRDFSLEFEKKAVNQLNR